jgi:Ca-activated chloride channel family protein
MAGAKIESVRAALSRLIDQLDERDRLAIVLFDDRVDLLWESSPVSDRQAIRARLPEIWARGSTDMASGLRAGFAQVQHNAGRAGVSDRVIVLTDAMTNTGDTDTTTFIELAQENASRGIGLTLFGVGLDLNQELVLAVSKLRGGNYVFLTEDKIATVFDVDFDYLVTPLAYDLRLSLTPQPGFRIAQVYGYPSFREGSRSVEIAVATVFLSRNHGAIVARLEREGASWPAGKPPLAALSLSYEPRGGGERAFDSWQATCEAGEGLGDTTVFYSQRAVRKTVALVNAAIGMRRGCELFWQGSADAAQDLVRRVVGLLRDEGAAIEDAELRGEADDAQRLLDNMLEAAAQGAPACRASGSCQDPYDPYGRRRLFACNFGAGQSVAASGASPAGSLLLLGLAIGLARVLRRGR